MFSVFEQDNEHLPVSVVLLPALTPQMNSQSDFTEPINQQTTDAGFKDFTVTLMIKSGNADWMKGQARSPVDISTNSINQIIVTSHPQQQYIFMLDKSQWISNDM